MEKSKELKSIYGKKKGGGTGDKAEEIDGRSKLNLVVPRPKWKVNNRHELDKQIKHFIMPLLMCQV